MANKFHLAYFFSFIPDAWKGPFGAGGSPWDGGIYVELAQALERACFDYALLEDKLMIPESYGGSSEPALRYGMKAPQHDPIPLAVAMGLATKHLGIVATMSTLAYPPFMTARLASTIDSMLDGRFGWNIVTSAEDLAAQNFGLDVLPPREMRYEMADEYVEVVRALFDSWDQDAVILDRERGIYADHSGVRPINFRGKHFSVRGPLNTVPSPQQRPAFVQAGASPRGRAFAARNADCIIATAGGQGIAGMKRYRDEVRELAKKAGRNPDQIKLLYLASPILGDTEEDAHRKRDRITNTEEYVHSVLTVLSGITEIDFSQFDLDKPLPHRLSTNGEQGSLDQFQQWGSGKTLRQLATDSPLSSVELIGTPDQVAEQMGSIMEQVGGDGFMLVCPELAITRRYIAEITEGLAPALQRRGLVRTEYTQRTLRESLREF